MQARVVPAALRERLGGEGTAGLYEVLEYAQNEWSTDVIATTVARFEGRLVEESADVKVALAETEGRLRLEMAAHTTALRQEMAGLATVLRQEMAGLATDLRKEMAILRFDVLKWSLLFWTTQMTLTIGLIFAVLRLLGLAKN
jgi:hypothetical protein